MEKQALLEIKDGIAIVTLNNPKSFNSMSQALLDDTFSVMQEVENDPNVRVVVFTGSGKAFCAGGDLPYIETFKNSSITRRYMQCIAKVSTIIYNMSKPVIAMVNGVAAGAGCNWVLACDIIFTARSARFSQSFMKVGLVPDGGGTYFLPRLVGLCKAKELAFTANIINAETAERIGLVNRVIDDDKLRYETVSFATDLAAGAPIALGLMKKILNTSHHLDLQSCLEMEIGMQILCMETDDHKEGIKAFKEKRLPVFKGQ